MEVEQPQVQHKNDSEMQVEEAAQPVEKFTGTPFNHDLLRMYYQTIFPFKNYFRWLGYKSSSSSSGPMKDYVLRREFSFTLPGDIYCRYQSFKNEEAFKARLLQANPEKIDIGAVFNIPPSQHNTVDSNAFNPVERELVFDIDMDDYDDIRTSAQGAVMTKKCWTFMAAAIEILDRSLRDDFGFEHFFFVFSGRRGVHCWVCDKIARQLPNDKRAAVADYLNLISGQNDNQKVKFSLNDAPMHHPHVQRSIMLGKELLEREDGIMDAQEFMKTAATRRKMIATLPEQDRVHMETFCTATPGGNRRSGREMWTEFQRVVEARRQTKDNNVSPFLVDEWATEFTSPRLDINVSKSMNHLLKSPFCIHPKTGKVCVPIDPSKAFEFDPDAVPTIGQVAWEIDKRSKAGTHDSANAVLSTSVYPYFQWWEHNFLIPLEKSITEERKKADMTF